GKLANGWFHLGEFNIRIPEGKMKVLREQNYVDETIILGIRPEEIRDEPIFIKSTLETKITATIDVAELMQSEIYLNSQINIEHEEKIDLALDMNKAHFFDAETEKRIR